VTAAAHRPPCVLAVAGSDSGGGAGIQADLKALARCGVHGMTAVTAITAQSTTGVSAMYAVPPETIVAQVAAVAEDIGVDAVKIGMLGSIETIEAVERALALVEPLPIVLDPVMVAESGAALLEEQAVAALRERLLPRATVVTPNVMEARALVAGDPAAATAPEGGGAAELASLARTVHARGPGSVVVTGGHAAEPADAFFAGDEVELIAVERHPDGASHGSGCTHSSALAAALALGHSPLAAARLAQAVASEAVRDGLRAVGRGVGPVNALGLGVAERAEWRDDAAAESRRSALT
jgi:hydroxymethylpyrimidine/phosphomethylpyrimidine kinase